MTKAERIETIKKIRTAISDVRWELIKTQPPFTEATSKTYRDAEGCLTAAIVLLYEELQQLEGVK